MIAIDPIRSPSCTVVNICIKAEEFVVTQAAATQTSIHRGWYPFVGIIPLNVLPEPCAI